MGLSSELFETYTNSNPIVCIGMHLAKMEMALAAASFFRECPTARLSPKMTDDMMELENYFLVAPKGHKCEIVM